MMLNSKTIVLYAGSLLLLWSSCTKNIEPLPSSVTLKPSYSFPIGLTDIKSTNSFQTIGLPIVNLTEDVPEWAKYGFVYYTDTIPLNIKEIYDKAESIVFFSVRTNIWNSYPMKGVAQIYFLDESNTVIDSLYNPRVEVPPAVLYNGVVSNRFESYGADIDRSRIELLSSATKVVIFGGLEITDDSINPSNVNSFDSFGLKIQVAARVDFIYTSN